MIPPNMIDLLIIALIVWSIVGLIRVTMLIVNGEAPNGNTKQATLFLIVHGPGVIIVALISLACVAIGEGYDWLYNKLGDKTS